MPERKHILTHLGSMFGRTRTDLLDRGPDSGEVGPIALEVDQRRARFDEGTAFNELGTDSATKFGPTLGRNCPIAAGPRPVSVNIGPSSTESERRSGSFCRYRLGRLQNWERLDQTRGRIRARCRALSNNVGPVSSRFGRVSTMVAPILGPLWPVAVKDRFVCVPRRRRGARARGAAGCILLDAARDGDHPCPAMSLCLVSLYQGFRPPRSASAPLVRLFWGVCTATDAWPSASRPPALEHKHVCPRLGRPGLDLGPRIGSGPRGSASAPSTALCKDMGGRRPRTR